MTIGAQGTHMTTLGRQLPVRRRTVVALAVAGTILLPLALPAGAENLSPGTGGLLDTAEEGVGTSTGTVQQAGSGTPLQGTTNKAAVTVQKTVTRTTGTLRQPAAPAPTPNPQPGAPISGQSAPPPGAPTNPSPIGSSDVGSLIPANGSASGLRVNAATLLLAREAIATPLVAEALSASPSALVLVAEPLARSLNVPMGSAPDAATTSGGTVDEVQAASNLPQGLLTEALIAAALLVAATAALVSELGLKRSSPRAT